jgi:hypothetical protein
VRIPVIVRLTPEQLAAVDVVAQLCGSSVPAVLEEQAERLLAGARRLVLDAERR